MFLSSHPQPLPGLELGCHAARISPSHQVFGSPILAPDLFARLAPTLLLRSRHRLLYVPSGTKLRSTCRWWGTALCLSGEVRTMVRTLSAGECRWRTLRVRAMDVLRWTRGQGTNGGMVTWRRARECSGVEWTGMVDRGLGSWERSRRRVLLRCRRCPTCTMCLVLPGLSRYPGLMPCCPVAHPVPDVEAHTVYHHHVSPYSVWTRPTDLESHCTSLYQSSATEEGPLEWHLMGLPRPLRTPKRYLTISVAIAHISPTSTLIDIPLRFPRSQPASSSLLLTRPARSITPSVITHTYTSPTALVTSSQARPSELIHITVPRHSLTRKACIG